MEWRSFQLEEIARALLVKARIDSELFFRLIRFGQ